MARRSFIQYSMVVAGAVLGVLATFVFTSTVSADDPAKSRRLLYVAVPGIRDYLQYGGHGVLVFDIDNGHKFVRRIQSAGMNEKGKPINVKGICVSVSLQRLYVSTIESLIAFDLTNDLIVWERKYDGGCDRMAVSPDGKTIYMPSFEKDHWHVLDAVSGNVITRVEPQPGAHNTNYGATQTDCEHRSTRGAGLDHV